MYFKCVNNEIKVYSDDNKTRHVSMTTRKNICTDFVCLFFFFAISLQRTFQFEIFMHILDKKSSS